LNIFYYSVIGVGGDGADLAYAIGRILRVSGYRDSRVWFFCSFFLDGWCFSLLTISDTLLNSYIGWVCW